MCFNMPPRKKQRVSGGKQVAASVASGADTTAVAMCCDDLPDLMKACLQVLEAMFSLRHADSSHIHLAEAGPLKPKDGIFEWPITFGGTFKSIAQRAWADPDRLLELSAQMAFKAEFTQSADVQEFVQQFCKMEARSGSNLNMVFLCFLYVLLF